MEAQARAILTKAGRENATPETASSLQQWVDDLYRGDKPGTVVRDLLAAPAARRAWSGLARASRRRRPGGADDPLDASALLALMFAEPGHEQVAEQLDAACLSTVNLAEVAARFARDGHDPRELCRRICASPSRSSRFSPTMLP